MKKNEKTNARQYFYMIQQYERETGQSALGKDGKPKGVFKEYIGYYGIKPASYTESEKKDILSMAIKEGIDIESVARKLESRTDHKAYIGNKPTNFFINSVEEMRFLDPYYAFHNRRRKRRNIKT